MGPSPENTSSARTRKRNGEGNTYPHKSGYRTVIVCRGCTVTAMGRTAAESRRRAKEKVRALPSNANGSVSPLADLTVAEFFQYWLTETHRRQIADSTYQRYLGLMKKFLLPILGEFRLQSVSKTDINHLLIQMQQSGQSPRSRQQARALMSVAFNAAVADELIPFNPVAKAMGIRHERYEIQPLSIDEVQKLLTSTKGTQMHARMRIALLYGLRQGEALGLQWSDIDFDSHTLSISKQVQSVNHQRVFVGLKSATSRRTLELDPETIVSLKVHKAMQNDQRLAAGLAWTDHDLLFPNTTGGPKDDRVDSRQWLRELTACKIAPKRLHDARHTAATLLYDQGADIEVIRRFLGNSSVELTSKTYVHHSVRALRGAALLIGSMLDESRISK